LDISLFLNVLSRKNIKKILAIGLFLTQFQSKDWISNLLHKFPLILNFQNIFIMNIFKTKFIDTFPFQLQSNILFISFFISCSKKNSLSPNSWNFLWMNRFLIHYLFISDFVNLGSAGFMFNFIHLFNGFSFNLTKAVERESLARPSIICFQPGPSIFCSFTMVWSARS
jgi:hypothetical protein